MGEALYVEPRASGEHVQRFSQKMLDELHEWSSHGASTWSEMASPTVCTAVPGLRCRTLDPNTVGDPFHFAGRIDEAQWSEIQQDPQKGTGCSMHSNSDDA